VSLVDFGEVALPEQIRKLEDIILDFFVDGSVIARGLMFDHSLINIIPNVNKNGSQTYLSYQL
jgi:hypothetical protein